MAMESNHQPSYKGFWALVVTQFQNAFNDNAYKNLILLAALHAATNINERNLLNSVIPAVFILPFLLFSMHAGYLADRFSKRTVMIATKFWEIFAMLLGALAFFTGHLWFSIAILFLTGTQSSFYGPSKYGVIPELIPEKRISWANGIIELTTFLAIIMGTFFGTYLMEVFRGRLHEAMYLLTGLAIFGFSTSFLITETPAANPTKKFTANFFKDLYLTTKMARLDTLLWMAILGNTFFWFMGALLFINIPPFAMDLMHLKDTQIGQLLAVMSLGIGLGSYAAGHLSGNKIEYGLIPLGAAIMSIGGVIIYGFGHSYLHVVIVLGILGFGGGFFVVPINALIQHRPKPEDKGAIQGLSYFLSNVGVVLASVVFYLFTVVMHIKTPTVFLIGAIMTIIATVYYCYRLPDAMVRLVLWLLTNTFYRIKVVGRDNIPERGGALFVTNHMSFTDALFMIASTDRFIRFIMYTGFYKMPWVKPFAKIMRAIPMSAEDGARELIHSFRDATNAIENGEVVCIFAEGQITRIGQMLPFRRGFERIIKGVDAPIIPIHLDRIWGAIFSFKNGRMVLIPSSRIPYPLTVSFGKPLPSNTDVQEVRRVVQELSTEAFNYRRKDMKPLHHALFQEARWHTRRFAMADGMNPKVSYGEVLIRTFILGKKLKSTWSGQEKVGLFMPPSVAGACLNYAALFCGKIPVNLNYTLSQEALNSCLEQCHITTVITARAFMEKIKLTIPVKTIYLEDIAAHISITDKLSGWIKANLLPRRWVEKSLGCQKKWTLDDMVTIIFSSGSTGNPKGVMLSHYNIYSNLEGIAQVMTVEKTDRILGVLPFFHSFGFTGTLWFPFIKGFGAVFHPNPTDARTIGILSEKYQVSLLVATPSFLQTYIKRVAPGQFGSLRFVLVGAEKLPDRVAFAFEDRFGLRPYEAYGCTECSPAVTINTPSYRARGFYQVGGKHGSIGQPLPGVGIRIVDPDTFEQLPVGATGLLLVKGPNVMLGYLNQPEKTAEVLKDGWYNTGDIATMDEDGFLTITDRISRFSKIGGEMVPHVKIEEVLHQLADATEQTFVVTAVPDENKGERLIVLHLADETTIKSVLEKLPSAGLPNLWNPKPDAFYHIDAIPLLGTGKMDLRQIKQLALEVIEKPANSSTQGLV